MFSSSHKRCEVIYLFKTRKIITLHKLFHSVKASLSLGNFAYRQQGDHYYLIPPGQRRALILLSTTKSPFMHKFSTFCKVFIDIKGNKKGFSARSVEATVEQNQKPRSTKPHNCMKFRFTPNYNSLVFLNFISRCYVFSLADNLPEVRNTYVLPH